MRQIREAGESLGIHVVINARTDVYLEQVGDSGGRFDETVRRLAAYRRAGADSLFVPGVEDAETIARLAKAVDGPLNILAGPATPTVTELERIGVRRVSFGSWPARSALGLFSRFAHELVEKGTFATLDGWAMPYAEANRLVSQ